MVTHRRTKYFIMLISNLPSVRSLVRSSRDKPNVGNGVIRCRLSPSFSFSLHSPVTPCPSFVKRDRRRRRRRCCWLRPYVQPPRRRRRRRRRRRSFLFSLSFLYLEMYIRFIRSPLRWRGEREREKRVAPLPIRQFNSCAHTFFLRVSRLFFASVIFSLFLLSGSGQRDLKRKYLLSRREKRRRKETRIFLSFSPFVRESYGLSLLFSLHFISAFRQQRDVSIENEQRISTALLLRTRKNNIRKLNLVEREKKSETHISSPDPIWQAKLFWLTYLSILAFHTASNKVSRMSWVVEFLSVAADKKNSVWRIK